VVKWGGVGVYLLGTAGDKVSYTHRSSSFCMCVGKTRTRPNVALH